jgi:hypothetical protein
MEFDKTILSNNFDILSLFNAYSKNIKDLERLIALISMLVQKLLST